MEMLGVLIAVVLIAATIYFFFFRSSTGRPGTASKGGLGGLRRRTKCFFVGLCGSGKTALFDVIVNGKAATKQLVNSNVDEEEEENDVERMRSTTYTSTAPNEGTAAAGSGGKGITICDFPGHRKLRPAMFSALAEASVVTLVIDATSVEDEKDAIGELLLDLYLSKHCKGVGKIVIACNKRDEVHSYSVKAIRRILQAEMATLLKSKKGTLSSISGGAAGKRGGGAAGEEGSFNAALEALLTLTSFSFDEDAPVQTEFVETSAKLNSKPFSTLPLLRAIGLVAPLPPDEE